ncbi:MAG TPA: HupE/UreJ family protein [Polyangiaceae bacterium]|nr:HupE/UreJ family protein [Polyangiaceae bacterium]
MDASLARSARALVALALAALALLLAGGASAHTPDLSQSEFSAEPGARIVNGVLVFHWQDAVRLASDEGPSRGDAGSDAFARLLKEGVRVTADGAACIPSLESARPVEGDGFAFVATFSCPREPETLSVALPLLGRFPATHRHLARVSVGAFGVEKTLSAAAFELSAARAPTGAPGASLAESALGRASRALGVGVLHILSGWDHVLFLLALVLGIAPMTARALVLPVTAFTVAHSLTLALAAFSVFSPSSRWVEPAILLSVAAVALENVYRPGASHRERLTFAFGTIHGFGFAEGLRELGLERSRLLPTLLGFNAGVELGQLLVLPPLVLLAHALRKRSPAGPRRASIALGLFALAAAAVRMATQ